MRKLITIFILLALTASTLTGCFSGTQSITEASESNVFESSEESSSADSSSRESSEESSEESEEPSAESSAEESSVSSESTSSSAESSTEPSASSNASSGTSSGAVSASKPSSSGSSSTDSSSSAASSSTSSAESQAESSDTSSTENSTESSSASSAESSAETNGISASDVYAAIDAAFQTAYGHGPISNAPLSVDDVTLEEKFHISPSQVESYSGVIAGMMTNCDELLVVKAKDGEIDKVKTALEQALSEQKQAFEWYGVMFNNERLDAAKVVVSGSYAALLIVGVMPEDSEAETVDFSSDVSMAEKAFNEAVG